MDSQIAHHTDEQWVGRGGLESVFLKWLIFHSAPVNPAVRLKMIRPTKFLPGTQDPLSRKLYVVSARPDLIAHLDTLTSQVDPEDIAYLVSPAVVMTAEVPFERDLEGWGSAIENKCKEAFIHENLGYPPMSLLSPPDGLLKEMKTTTEFFDRWWTAEAADKIELEDGAWKTSECHQPSQKQAEQDGGHKR